jgi:hypothetical protein
MEVAMRSKLLLLSGALLLGACDRGPVPDVAAHRAAVDEWHAQRVARLTSESGWLTLVGLYWLQPGSNAFGRDPGNALVLDHPAMPTTLGEFLLADGAVRFRAAPGATVTADGAPVTELALASDAADPGPTVLASGSLRFYLIDRVGRLGVRVRDVEHPLRRGFAGVERYPVDPGWVVAARYERYPEPRQVRIVNVLGMTDEMTVPGALVFERDGAQHRLDAILESPDDDQLFVMFADATSGHGTYGAGRFMYLPLPEGDEVAIDFNRAYNPPCAFNQFATCPLPPPQNRLALAVTAGEKDYHAAR